MSKFADDVPSAVIDAAAVVLGTVQVDELADLVVQLCKDASEPVSDPVSQGDLDWAVLSGCGAGLIESYSVGDTTADEMAKHFGRVAAYFVAVSRALEG